jgi:hypothetical protein
MNLKNWKKTLITILISMSFFVSIQGVSASTQSENMAPVKMEFPSVAINSMLMDEYVYSPGSDIKFKVNLENISKSPNQFTKSIVLYENNPGGSEKRILDIRRSDEVLILAPGERVNKDISYSVPSFAKGNLILSLLILDTSGRSINRKEITINQTEVNSEKPPVLIQSKIRNSIESAVITQTKSADSKSDSEVSLDLKSLDSDKLLMFNDENDLQLKVSFAEFDSANTVEVRYGNQIERKSIQKESFFKIKPIKGSNLLSVSVYDTTGNLASPVVAKDVFVQGIEGVVQAFGIVSDGKDISSVKKGSLLPVYVHWIPEVYAVNQEKLLSDPIFNTPFTAYIYLYDVQGSSRQLIGSSTAKEIGVQFVSDIKIEKESKSLIGKIEIFSGNYKVAEYERVLIAPKQEMNMNFSNSKLLLSVLLVLVGITMLYMFYTRKTNKNILNNSQSGKIMMPLIFIFAVLSFVFPNVVSAQWQTVTSGVLNHYYPRDIDSSTTTWKNVLVSGSPNYNVQAFSQACPANPVLTGATSNYVSINNPLISNNGKAYRWEYSWYPTRNSGTSVFNLPNWFSVQEQYAGSGSGYRYPTYPARDARPIIPSNYLYSQSAFIDQRAFNRTARITDNMFSSWNSQYADGWNMYRPLRFTVSSSLYSALATSTYSNLIPWLEARFNAFDRRVDNISDSGLGYLNYPLLSSMIPGSYVAASGRLFYSIFSNPFGQFTSTTTNFLLQSAGYTDSDLLFNFDAGSFINNYTPGQGNRGISTSYLHRLGAYPEYGTVNAQLDCVEPYDSVSCKNTDRAYLEGTYSRPGTYNLMNILVTSRLGNIVPMNFDGRGGYQCQSNNAQVYTAPYEVVDNSYIAVVMFNDENADGIKQSNEKTIVSADNFSEGYVSSIDNGTISKNHGLTTSCAVPTVASRNRQLPFYYATSSSQIAKMYEEKILSASPWWQYIAPVPYVRTDAQVINPTYLASFSSTSPSLAINNVTINGYQTVGTPNYWIQNSGMGSYDYTRQYDSQGRLRINSTTQNCGHVTLVSNSIGVVTSGTSTLTAEEFSKQTSQYPLSSDVANNYTAYSKFAVDSELSPTYTVGIDPNTLSAGWTRTKEASASGFEKTVAVNGGNENHVVYLGVTYSSPGVCGSATSTTAMTTTPPSNNLCSAGSSTSVVSNDQNFSWSCNGVGNGSANTSCIKPKCPSSNPYYCAATNACVTSVSQCVVAGVCGSATSYAGQTSEGPALAPTTNLCSAGTLNGSVAGQGDPVSAFTWSCSGQNGGASSPTCSQPKCSSASGLRYCAAVNECRTSCGTTGTSTLIFNARLNPWVVRDKNSSCVLSWNVAASADLPVECVLNGVSMGPKSSSIQRSSPVPVGKSTLSCKNVEVEQSTTTRCLLNPSFQEI